MTNSIVRGALGGFFSLLLSMAAHGQPTAEATVPGPIGSKFGEFVLDAQDIGGFSPVCKLIATYELSGFWFPQLENSPLLDRPEYAIAKGVKSYHHACRAEVARTRYYRERGADRRSYLAKQVVSEYSFVIEHTEYRPKDWPYLTALYVERGKGHLLIKDNARALADFTEALRLDRKNKDAYLALSNLHEDMGQKAKALEYATEGLRHAPTSSSLQKRYVKLGGKLPYPTPYPSAQATSQENPAPIAATETKPVTQTSPQSVPKPDGPAPLVGPSHGETKAPGAGDSVQPVVSDPGRPSGPPYCRFCP